MKFFQKVALTVSMVALACAPSLAQVNGLPDSGTYFIVNVASEEALQPVGASIGQNVFMSEFNKGGLQKWSIKRKFDLTTKKPTNRYTIALAGETTGLNFQPHPVADCSAIISIDPSVMVLEKGDAGLLVKSVAKNGDALYIAPSPPGPTETRFGPDDGSTKFRWKFIQAD
jgi:hypothetical protein